MTNVSGKGNELTSKRIQGEAYQRSEIRNGMRIDWNAPIEMDDGIILRADIFRPLEEGQYPAILSYGPYGKGITYEGAGKGSAYSLMWEISTQECPELLVGSSNKYQVFETLDPERWVPHGYICVRIDSRGSGWSEGFLDVLASRQIRDIYLCIEWVASQTWSNGNVGMAGASYYALTQWLVAALQPPHLKAMVPALALSDIYRDNDYHGGILSAQMRGWFYNQVVSVQYGNAEQTIKNPLTGEPVTGPEKLSPEELAQNRADFWGEIKKRPLDDAWYRERSADWSKITTPFLSLGNWNTLEEHLRGNLEGFTQAASEQKWLDVHGGNLLAGLTNDYYTRLQRRFFDHFLKGENNGWEQEPRVHLDIRHADGRQTRRYENEWPLARTQWTSYYLDAVDQRLTAEPQAEGQLTYEALGDGVTFLAPPLQAETEITGPMVARLWISSATYDADLFVRLRVLSPSGSEVVFHDRIAEAFSHVFGANFPLQPITCGWLRASHRKLDLARSQPYRPYHTHDEVQPLVPREIYQLDVEILPTSIVILAGYRLALSIGGRDYGLHNDPENRPPDVFGGKVTIHTGGAHPSHLLVPTIPLK